MTTTLAGLAGYSGAKDGTGAAAAFNSPAGVTTDRSGNIYVADSGNNSIRKLTAAGVVTTLAGSGAPLGPSGCPPAADGSGPAASFCNPSSVTVDSTGNLFVADTYNHAIRKVTPDGLVSTFAGSANSFGIKDGTGAQADFDMPIAITIDGTDNLYVSDMDTIRMITPGAVVTTIAGLNVQGGSANGTGTNARFFLPQGLAAASDGTVYVADTYANAIRVMTPATVVTTLAGTLNSSRGSADGNGAAAGFRNPYGITLSPDGNLYVADTGNNTIRKVTLAGEVSTIAGTPPIFGDADGGGTAATFNQPYGAATDASGNLYVVDRQTQPIRKITPAGVVSTLAVKDSMGNAVNFEYPTAIAVDATGNIYVADGGLCTIDKFSPAGVETMVFGEASNCGFMDGVPGRFNFPYGLAVDSSGNVYVADAQNNAVRKISPQGSVSTVASGAAASFSFPTGLVVGTGGAIYVVDSNNHAIRSVSSAGVVTTLAGKIGVQGSSDGTGTAATFDYPQALAIGQGGNLYVADFGNATIRKVSSQGEVSTVVGVPNQARFNAGALPGRIPNPSAVAVSNSSLYIVAANGIAVVTNVP